MPDPAARRPSDPFTIRPAQPEDHPVLGRLWREIDTLHARLQPGFFRPPQGLSRAENFIHRAICGPDETLLVAQVPGPRIAEVHAQRGELSEWLIEERESYLCGVIHLRVFSTPPSATMVQRRRAHVEDLVVANWARRHGCGRALMEQGVRWAQGRDATQMVLTVWAGNQGAEAFYRRLGYRPVSTVLGIEL